MHRETRVTCRRGTLTQFHQRVATGQTRIYTDLADGKSQNERRFGESFKGPILQYDAMVGYLPNSERDKSLERKCYQEPFLGML